MKTRPTPSQLSLFHAVRKELGRSGRVFVSYILVKTQCDVLRIFFSVGAVNNLLILLTLLRVLEIII